MEQKLRKFKVILLDIETTNLNGRRYLIEESYQASTMTNLLTQINSHNKEKPVEIVQITDVTSKVGDLNE